MDRLCDHQQHRTDGQPDEEQLPHELHPTVIGDVHGADDAHQSGGSGQDVVAEAVAEIEGKDRGLTGNAHEVGQRCQNGNDSCGLTAAGSQEDVDNGVCQQHGGSEQDGGDEVQAVCQCMDNGIGDVTGVHDAADGLCHADDEGSAQHLLAALKELFGDRGGTKAAQYAFDDSQCEEDSCGLRHIPVELDAAVDDEDKGCEEDQHDEDLAGVQLAEGVEVRSIAELTGLVATESNETAYVAQPFDPYSKAVTLKTGDADVTVSTAAGSYVFNTALTLTKNSDGDIDNAKNKVSVLSLTPNAKAVSKSFTDAGVTITHNDDTDTYTASIAKTDDIPAGFYLFTISKEAFTVEVK